MGNNKKYCPKCKVEFFSPGNHKCPTCGTPLVSDWEIIQLSDARLEIKVQKLQEKEVKINGN